MVMVAGNGISSCLDYYLRFRVPTGTTSFLFFLPLSNKLKEVDCITFIIYIDYSGNSGDICFIIYIDYSGNRCPICSANKFNLNNKNLD